jgi:hypothetical protein
VGAAHMLGFALHNLEARADRGCQVSLVDDQEVRAGDAGAPAPTQRSYY